MKKAGLRSLFTFLLFIMFFLQFEILRAETNEATDDPEYWRAQGNVSNGFYDEESSFVDYGASGISLDEDYTLKFGVDVSKYQKNINWATAKANGVEFAIIRVGYRGYSSGELVEDEYYKKNIEGALSQGIPVGVYVFSQAITEAEAIEEANFVLSRISQYGISLPIVIDFEYAGNGSEGRLYAANLSKSQATSICTAFCKTVESSGYAGMVYANRSMLTNDLNAEELAENYGIWLAHYAAATTYTGTYDFWQYTSTGDGFKYGMGSQYVDLNYWYDDGSLCTTVYNGMDYATVFNPVYYADLNADLKAVYGYDSHKLLGHFVDHGMNEGRRGSAEFDLVAYKELNSDLVGVYGDDNKSYYIHYIEHGKAEGRKAVKESGGTSSPSTPGINATYYSAVFNATYYYNNNSDLASAIGSDETALLNHFIDHGMREGRRGSEEFDLAAYKELNSDLVGVYGDDNKSYYIHYIEHGKAEGRKAVKESGDSSPSTPDVNVSYYSVVFNAEYYYNNHNDLATVFGLDETALLNHFIEYGMREGRRGSEEFDVTAYKDLNSDLVGVYGDDNESYYFHYIEHGKAEGRKAVKESGGTTSPETPTVPNTSVSYYSAVFNVNYYYNNHSDLAAVYGADETALLNHFIEHGMSEGRRGSEEFDLVVYKDLNSDLVGVYGDDNKSYYIHYIEHGKAEGRPSR